MKESTRRQKNPHEPLAFVKACDCDHEVFAATECWKILGHQMHIAEP